MEGKKYTRSKAGCLSCRRRKKKCDETKPICNACKRLNLECSYVKDNLDWKITEPHRNLKNFTNYTTAKPISPGFESWSVYQEGLGSHSNLASHSNLVPHSNHTTAMALSSSLHHHGYVEPPPLGTFYENQRDHLSPLSSNVQPNEYLSPEPQAARNAQTWGTTPFHANDDVLYAFTGMLDFDMPPPPAMEAKKKKSGKWKSYEPR
ncbi:hypothetical protein PSN45_003140 [Yamadazyma tenuis]|uniref:uncharacterized protein n=1 Tax=Candida tenuis TaxID=2315449 RepID=UPI0027983B40|nr:hypothetical protein PSN45_003140 [Yamadazyma tenuis]